MAKEVENWQAHDLAWNDEKEELENGYFSRYGTFVKEEYLLEVAMEDVTTSSIVKDSFIEKVLEFIEGDKEATEKFLKWFYPDYEKE